MILLHGEM